MSETKTFTCIVCPRGCKVTAKKDGDDFLVSGNSCPKGKDFVIKELTRPERCLTSTVKTVFSEMPYLPVRTEGEIPKELLFKAMEEIHAFTLKKAVKVGDVVIKSIAGSHINLIATSNINV